MNRTASKTQQYGLVAAQCTLILIIVLVPLPKQFELSGLARSLFFLDMVAGIFIGARAIYDLRKSLAVIPEPHKDGVLQTKGIYSYIRHPMYAAVLLITFAVAFRAGNYNKIGAFVLLLGLLLHKSRIEERMLIAQYPKYKKYMEKVGRFIPR